MSRYELVTHWHLNAPIGAVWDALHDVANWPKWWSYVLDVEPLERGDAAGMGALHRITWGSALAAALWLAGSVLFSWYASNFGNFDATYGSLGAVIGFMTWLWISAIVVLIGAELDAELEHQTMRDTTTGRDQPLGARGATMADTVGRSR
jgi:membrane protein implicated in regulation of membrane protease activity